MNSNSANDPINIIFLSNRTNNFEKYENKLYAENLTEIEKFTEKYGLSGKKAAALDENLVKKYLKFLEENLIKQYDVLEKLKKNLMKNGVKYISFSYGGYSNMNYLLNI